MRSITHLFTGDDEGGAIDQDSITQANEPYESLTLSENHVDRFTPSEDVRDAIEIRPYKDDGGVGSAKDILTALHRYEEGFSWELVYGDELRMRIIPETQDISETIQTNIRNQYPNSEVEVTDNDLLPMHEGQSVSGAELSMVRNPMFPLRNSELTEWERDPLGTITNQMASIRSESSSRANVIVQMRFVPSPSTWNQGIEGGPSADALAHVLQQTEYNKEVKVPALDKPIIRSLPIVEKEVWESEPSEVDKRNAKLLKNYKNKPAWLVNIRVVAVSANSQEAKKRARKAANVFGSFYYTDTRQGYHAAPLTGGELVRGIEASAEREYIDGGILDPQPSPDDYIPEDKTSNKILITTAEAQDLFYAPLEEDITVDNMVWSLRKRDSGVPASMPRFEEYDQTGYTEGQLPATLRKQYDSDDHEWDYAVTPRAGDDARESVLGHESKIFREPSEATTIDPEEVFAGAWPAAMLRNVENDPSQPYYLGTDSNGVEVPLLPKHLPRHILAFGTSGSGKSSGGLVRVNAYNFNRADNIGGYVSDPGGEDFFKILLSLKKERFPDVHIIDVGSDYSEYQVGMNPLQTFLNPGDPNYNIEVNAKISVIMRVLGLGEHRRMERVSEHIFRGLIEANYVDEAGGYDEETPHEEKEEWRRLGEGVKELMQDDPSEPHEGDFTVEDAYTILGSKENREEWLNMIVEQGLNHLVSYARTLAEMDDDDSKLEPTLGRLKKALEDPVLRPLLTHRHSTISVADIYFGNEILFLKNDSPDKKLRKFVNSLVFTEFWTTILSVPTPIDQRRMERKGLELPGDVTHEDYDGFNQFMLSIDEGHSAVGPELDLEHFTAEARKRNAGLFFITQQFHQLPSGRRDEMIGNFNTVLAWNPGISGKEKRAVADMLPDVTKQELGSLPDYHAYTLLRDEQGNFDDPFVTEMFAPPVYRNSVEEVLDLIEECEKRDGVKMDEQDSYELGTPDRFVRSRVGGGESDVELTSERLDGVLETVIVAAARYDTAEEEAPMGDVVALMGHRLSEVGSEQKRQTLLQKCSSRGYVHIPPDASTISLTEEGEEILLGSGDAPNAGGIEHQTALVYILSDLIDAGYSPHIPTQGGEELPDLVGHLPVDIGGGSVSTAVANYQELIESHPQVAAVSGERPLAIEFEKSTNDSDPEQVTVNLLGCLTDGYHTMFTVPEGDNTLTGRAEKIARRFETPMLTNLSPSPDVDRQFIHGDKLDLEPESDDSVHVALPGSGTAYQWVEKDGELLMRERGGDIHARFKTLSEWQNRSIEDFGVTYRVTEDSVTLVDNRDGSEDMHTYGSEEELREEWSTVYEPQIPELMFAGDDQHVRLGDSVPDLIVDRFGGPTETSLWDLISIGIRPKDEEKSLLKYDPDTGETTPVSELDIEHDAIDIIAESLNGGGSDSDEPSRDESDGSVDDEDLWGDELFS